MDEHLRVTLADGVQVIVEARYPLSNQAVMGTHAQDRIRTALLQSPAIKNVDKVPS